MGAFAIYNNQAMESTVISNLFIDEYMKDANDAQIKIYLYLVRMMSAGLATSMSDIADKFNHTEKEVLRSLRYWERKGLLTLQIDAAGNLAGIFLREPRASVSQENHQVISIAPMLAANAGIESAAGAAAPVMPAVSVSASDSPAQAQPIRPEQGSDVSAEQLESFQQSDESRQLMFVVEQYIGKPLSVREAKTICFISDQLHFSDELIDYLVEYCVGLGKKDFRYIEKVALNWAESGISTAEQARKSVQTQTAARRASRSGKNTARSFQNFEKASYNMDELEKQLLSN